MFVIDKRICACCHNCADDCPMQAIDFVGTKYEIDQDKCVQCGLCAKVCHSGACHEEPVASPICVEHTPITIDCDIVVIGCGAGLVSAVRAAQAGKRVIVLEKSTKIGGNTDFAHGYMTTYSKWHARLGLPDEREDAVKYFMERGKYKIAEPLIRTAVYGVCDFFDWLCTQCEIEETYRLTRADDTDFHGPFYGTGVLEMVNRRFENLNCRDDAIGPGWGGTHVKHTMLDTIEREGLDVKIFTSTPAEHLVLDNTGRICGVLAQDPGGEVRINCSAVMLACGGFGRNDKLLAEWATFDFFAYPDVPIHRFSVPGDTGDAIAMLQELGVEPDPEQTLVSAFGPKHHPFNNAIADFGTQGEWMQVNAEGRRWWNESIGVRGEGNTIHQQPKGYSYVIMPREQVKAMAEAFVANPAFANKKQFYASWEYDLDHESTLDTPVKKADTLEELARLMGVDPAVFVAEVERYNRWCALGRDEDFGKDPQFLKAIPMDRGPYYAVYAQRFSEAAMGGVRVNEKCQVTRENGEIIPGLYAGGDCTSAMHRRYELAPISELTWAMASNYVAGGNMVAYLDGTKEYAGGEPTC